MTKFKQGPKSLEYDPRNGQPNTEKIHIEVEKFDDMFMQDRRFKISKIANDIGILDERSFHILTVELVIKTLSAIWLPRIWIMDQNRQRTRISQDSLERFNAHKTDLVSRFVATDETWNRYYIPETKQQSKHWRPSGSPPPNCP